MLAYLFKWLGPRSRKSVFFPLPSFVSFCIMGGSSLKEIFKVHIFIYSSGFRVVYVRDRIVHKWY